MPDPVPDQVPDFADARRYSRVAIVLHWTLAALILFQIVGGVVMHEMAYSDLKVDLYQWHKSFGLTVLALALLRLLWRLGHRPPPVPATLPRWQRRAAHLTHVGLYVFMIGVPLIGWAYISTTPRGFPTELFGLIPVPDLPLADDPGAATLWQRAHKATAVAFAALIALHAAAALYHHYRLRDPVLWRMAPWVSRKWVSRGRWQDAPADGPHFGHETGRDASPPRTGEPS